MKDSKKMFILMEGILAALVILLVMVMFWGRNGEEREKVSVIIQNADDSQWSAFKYGLRMAAQDQDIEMFVVSTGKVLTAEEEKEVIEREMKQGADAVIVHLIPGDGTESMLKRLKKRIPVMLIESSVSTGGASAHFPVTKTDQYAMGAALADALLQDYSGKLEGKKLGILSESGESWKVSQREKGLSEALGEQDVKVLWSVGSRYMEEEEAFVEALPKVDLVIALDDHSLTLAGKVAAANNLHGALVYGIGHSTEAVYYLDTDIVRCLVVPDMFELGYQSLTELSKSLRSFFYAPQEQTVPYMILRREELFSKEHREILYTMKH